MAEVLQGSGGVMTEKDLSEHRTDFQPAISIAYHGLRVHEVPPPTQGLAALLALRIIDGLTVEDHNSSADLHSMVEAMRLSFADSRAYIADPKSVPVPVEGLLSDEYTSQRRAQISPTTAQADPVAGSPPSGSDTVQVGSKRVWFQIHLCLCCSL